MRRILSGVVAACIAAVGAGSQAQTLTPINSFGVTAPGWLAPGDYGFNNVDNATVRSIAYHAPSNRLVVVDRNGGLFVRVLDADTGEQVHLLNSTDIVLGQAPGFFVGNMVGIDDDGNVYMNNLLVSNAPGFAVYRWSSDAVENLTDELYTTAYLGAHNRNRVGDSFAVIGSGANTRIVSAGGNTAGDSAFVLLTTANGLNFSLTNPPVTGHDNGAYRLGIDFDGAGKVLGTQTTPIVTIAPEVGGAAQTSALTTENQSVIAYHAPTKLLATIAFTTSNIRLYDASDLSDLQFLDIQNLTTNFVSNGNGVGSLSFGYDPDGKLRLYALNANNGIQAYEVSMPASGAEILSQSVVHNGYTGSGSNVDSQKALHKEDAVPATLGEQNIINTSRGINGVQFEIQDLAEPTLLSASDFTVQLSPLGSFDQISNPPSGWSAGPAPSVTVSGTNPYIVSLQWANNQISNRWLRLTVLGNSNTGLASDCVFYLGHLLGKTTGVSAPVASVTFADITPIRSEVGGVVDADSILDIDKSGSITFGDISAMRGNVGTQLTVITVP